MGVECFGNIGVAPNYNRRTLTYRLRGNGREERTESPADTRQWLPGNWDVVDAITLPADLPQGTYSIELGLLDRAGSDPTWSPLPPFHLAISGRMDDGWYAIGNMTVQ